MSAFENSKLDIGGGIAGVNTVLDFPLRKSFELFSLPLVPTVCVFFNAGKVLERSEVRSWARMRKVDLRGWKAEMGTGFSLECVAFAGLALRLRLPLLTNTNRASLGLRLSIGSAF